MLMAGSEKKIITSKGNNLKQFMDYMYLLIKHGYVPLWIFCLLYTRSPYFCSWPSVHENNMTTKFANCPRLAIIYVIGSLLYVYRISAESECKIICVKTNIGPINSSLYLILMSFIVVKTQPSILIKSKSANCENGLKVKIKVSEKKKPRVYSN